MLNKFEKKNKHIWMHSVIRFTAPIILFLLVYFSVYIYLAKARESVCVQARERTNQRRESEKERDFKELLKYI